jgi:hypothetical protein
LVLRRGKAYPNPKRQREIFSRCCRFAGPSLTH